MSMSNQKLARVGILSYLDEESLENLQDYGAELATEPEQIVITEGDKQNHLYVVVSGAYAVEKNCTHRSISLDRVDPGDCFGEIAIFQPGLASATVRSLDSGSLWYTDVAHLQNFLIANPVGGSALLLGINTILTRRLIKTNQVIKGQQVLPSFLSVRNKLRLTGPVPS